ncbi:biopolymer transporter ExbD [Vulcanimicrobium alpinum]|uniref:Biopolymer transporter ExbD n=1 Tax=Vulcanimicrobium alpinum TaxID=3016050 RepID=A0AAN2CAX7_UNVUL|nr:biopolymer transporter ExbD [Vulcanimicrobium alpinum]BDE07077.1 biopolymer transporter ExbD [Vulcanimicrobium alpinum]
MSMVSASQDDEVMAEINITPFTDVLLVLLIIFMILAALSAPPGFEKQLPDKNDNTPQQQQKKTDDIEVLVNETGVIYIDGKRTDVQHIYADMSDVQHRKGNKHVSLTADVKAPYGTIIRILDAAKIAGLEDVGFVTS